MIRPDRNLPSREFFKRLCERIGGLGAEPPSVEQIIESYREGTDAHRALEAIQLSEIGKSRERARAFAYIGRLNEMRFRIRDLEGPALEAFIQKLAA